MRAKTSKYDGKLAIFNSNELGIDLDAVMVSLISENDTYFISTALQLMRRNRRYANSALSIARALPLFLSCDHA
jgi:hypothetical protein